MFLFIILLVQTGQLFCQELFPDENIWLVSALPPVFANLSAQLSPDCFNDTETWLKSIAHFTIDLDECIASNGTACTKEKQKEMMMDFYGVKQLDSFGHIPSGILNIKTVAYGDVAECQEVSKHFYYHTKYCFLHSKISLNSTCDSEPKAALKSAICMPKSCTEEDIIVIFTHISEQINSPFAHCSVTCKRDEGITYTFTWIYLGFMSALVTILLVASVVDYILEIYYQTSSKDVKNPALQALLAFSIYTNGSVIWNTSPAREGHLKCLDCIRFISMIWVASGHVLNFTVANDELIPLLNLPKPILVDTLMSSFFSVDTFFVLSGLLVAYMFFKALEKSPKMVKNPFTWILFYVHRYLRLTPPYMLFICFFMAVAPLMTGVLMTEWDVNGTVVAPCRKYWWQNLLYINNLFDDPPCYGISWYLACDMQMYLVAPVFLIAFLISHWIGLASVVLACIGSSIATIILTIHYKLPATAARPEKAQEFNDYLYEKSWIRCPPYFIGLAAGYYLAKYGSKRIKIHWIFSLIGWIVNLAMALAIIYGPHDYLALETNWSLGIRGFYNAGSRIGWAFFIVWIIGANHFGYGGPIAKLMENPIWQPFGRLSYSAYLCHMFLIYYMWNLQDRPLHFPGVWTQFVNFTLPVVAMAYFFAFFWSCLCEIPFLKLEKLIVDAVVPKKGNSFQSSVEEKKKEKLEQWVD